MKGKPSWGNAGKAEFNKLEGFTLTWAKPDLPDCAYGYYGNTERMYCKVERSLRDYSLRDYYSNGWLWLFYRSDSNNHGYLMPTRMEGVQTVEEAKAVAQVYYFMNGEQWVDVREENNKAADARKREASKKFVEALTR